MSPVLYDFLNDLSEVIVKEKIKRIHRINIDFDEGILSLLHYTEHPIHAIYNGYIDCADYGGLKVELVAQLPYTEEYSNLPHKEEFAWLLWGGYFSILYDRFLRLKSIDDIINIL